MPIIYNYTFSVNCIKEKSKNQQDDLHCEFEAKTVFNITKSILQSWTSASKDKDGSSAVPCPKKVSCFQVALPLTYFKIP